MTFKLISPAFRQNGPSPSQYTCEGDDISPPLQWSDAPSGTRSLALVMDDPDSPDPAKPERVYVHWVVYNISPLTTKLPLNAAMSGLPVRARHGTNDWGKQAYGGPCPRIGKHRYFFKIVCARHPVSGSEGSYQGTARSGDGGPSRRQCRAGGYLREAEEIAQGRIVPRREKK